MRRLSVRFTIRSMVIATALVAVNLAGVMATWKAYPSTRITHRVGLGPQLSPYLDDDGSDIRAHLGTFENGQTLVRLVKPPPRPGLLEILSPVIGSASITLLAAVVALGRRAARRASTSLNGDSGHSTRSARAWRGARCVGIVAGLIGLNVAGLVASAIGQHDERLLPPRIWSDPTQFLDDNGSYVVRGGKTRPIIKSGDGRIDRPATLADYPLPLHDGDGQARVFDTVIYKPDGSIVRYKGNPGLIRRILIQPHVLQPPTRTFLEVWWPTIGSMSISLVIIVILWRQARSRFTSTTSESNARVDHDESL
jgi:hypothetical protein